MIELERHIEVLLLSNDCVIVPGLGGFVAHHVDAYYDEEERQFFPPLRTVGFNPKLDMNDSLLIHSYTEAYDISYPEAENRVRKEVNELKRSIGTNGEYSLNNIGVLAANDNGTYDFTPCEAGILTPELYGLCPFEFEKAEETNKVPTINIDTIPVKAANTLTPQAAGTITDIETGENTISIKVSAIRNVTAFVIAVVAFFFISTPLGSDKKPGMEMSKIENGVIYRLMPKDVMLGNIKNIGTIKRVYNSSPITKKDVMKKQEMPQAVQTIEKERYYCIVFASRITRKNAEAFAEQIRKKGLDNVNVIKDINGIKVVSGKYESKKDANEMLGKIKKDTDFNDCWIYQVNN